MNKRHITLNILQTLSLIVVIYVNYLANALPINGMTTGALSALYPNFFVPAGFTFSIWGVIYILLIIYVAGSWMPKAAETNFMPYIWFIVTGAANAGWIFAWHFRMVWASVAVMILLLFSLIRLYLLTRESAWFLRLPVSVYMGWITVALIANITALLVHLGSGINTSFEAYWAVIMMSVAVVLTTLLRFRFNDPWYQLVTLWALFGIAMKFNGSEILGAKAVFWAALFLMVSTFLSVVIPLFISKARPSGSD